ncbi:IS110 family transposase [Nonomuraea sp. NPDC046802]|uniref:IS110 family transposase n=1 Tax=Nonomuraea sp. NPDC046802 TaxID=3154919 RepID=UPI0034047EAA
MQVLYQRCAAIDVGKDEIAIALRTPGDGPQGRTTIKRTYKTFYGVLKEAARWLTGQGVTHVAMEATGIYSMPVYHAMIEHGRFEQVLVCNPGHVKNVPGRKTDYADAEWLAQLLECGLLNASFIPTAQVKAARDVLRYRTKVVQQRTSEIQRLGAVLQDAGIKLDSVASSIATVSGRRMIEALIDGERRGAMLAELSLGKMRAKIPDLSMALEGRFDDHHALMCRLHLEHLDLLDEMIAKLDAQVEEMMVPFRVTRELLTSIPGVGPMAAAQIIGEIGVSPHEFFATAAKLAAWSGLAPGNHESAGKRKSGRRRHGNQHLQPVLVEAAWAAVRHTGYLRSLYHRHVMKNGGYRSGVAKKKAIVTVAHAMIVIIWHVLATGRPYHELGEDYFTTRKDPEKEAEKLIAKLEALGHKVTLEPAAA